MRLFSGLIAFAIIFATGCDLWPSQKPQTGESGKNNQNTQTEWETPAKTEMLVDFTKEAASFEGTLSTVRNATWEQIEGEGIKFNNPSAWNSRVIYTLPTPFVSEFSRERGNPRPYSITITWKLIEPSGSTLTILGTTLQGNEFYVDLGSSSLCQIKQEGEYYASTFTWTDLTQREPGSGPNVTVTEGTSVLDSLKSIAFRHNKNGSTIIKSIEFTENKVSWGENENGEYVLADFNSSQYEKLLTLNDFNSGTAYDIVDSALEISTSPRLTWWEAAVNYRLLKAVLVSSMKEFKFRSQVNFSIGVELVDEEGNGLKITGAEQGVSVSEQDEDGWYQYVVDIPTILANGFNNSLTENSKIVTIRMTGGSSSDVIYFDDLVYTKK